MATCVVDYRFGCSTDTYLRVRAYYTHCTYSWVRPQIFRIYEFRRAWCESKPFLVVPTKNVSRARLNSSYISTLLKVEVSGSCIIVFLDAILRISPPWESGSGVEDDVLWLREAKNSLVPASEKELRPDFSLLVQRRVRNNESRGLQIRLTIRRARNNLALTVRYIIYSSEPLYVSTYFCGKYTLVLRASFDRE